MSDLWHWRAVYRDETHFDEYDEGGAHHSFTEVDIANVGWVILIPQQVGLMTQGLKIAPGSRPIFFRRTLIQLIEGEERERVVVHCLGFQRTYQFGKKKRNAAHYTFFFPDGSVLVTDDFQAI